MGVRAILSKVETVDAPLSYYYRRHGLHDTQSLSLGLTDPHSMLRREAPIRVSLSGLSVLAMDWSWRKPLGAGADPRHALSGFGYLVWLFWGSRREPMRQLSWFDEPMQRKAWLAVAQHHLSKGRRALS